MGLLLDLVLGSILLCCSLPLIVAAAIAIRLESKGSPFFMQTRVGLNGQPFTIFKLHGMYADARERFPTLYDYSQQPYHCAVPTLLSRGQNRSTARPSVGKLGRRHLRSSALL